MEFGFLVIWLGWIDGFEDSDDFGDFSWVGLKLCKTEVWLFWCLCGFCWV